VDRRPLRPMTASGPLVALGALAWVGMGFGPAANLAVAQNEPPASAASADGDPFERLQARVIETIASAEGSVAAIARVRRNADPARQDESFPGSVPNPSDPGFVPNEFGTGVVIDPAGLILTAYHVLGNPEENDYYVWLNRVPFKAVKVQSVRAADPWMDLAVLHIEATDLAPIRFGDADAVKKGQFVVALGNPSAIARDGLPSASWGIVSNLARKAVSPGEGVSEQGRETLHHYGTLIQTDAKVGLGTSGGPLLNLNGEMVGLLVALSAGPVYDHAAGFAIPVDAHFKRTVETLKSGKRADFGFLGVLPWTLTRDERRNGMRGARIRDVVPGTPASRALLRSGDIILSVDNHDVYDDHDLIRYVSANPPEAQIELTVQRGRELLTQRVRLSKKAVVAARRPIATVPDPEWRGIRVDYVTAMAEFPTRSHVLAANPCVGVIEVQQDSPAWRAGIRPGDFIATVGRTRVDRPADFFAAVDGRSGDVSLGVLVDGRVAQRVIAAP